MGVSSRMAKMMDGSKSSRSDKIMDSMFDKTMKELNELRDKYSGDSLTGMSARNEIDRRLENKAAKKGDIDAEYSAFERQQPKQGKKAAAKVEKAADKRAEDFAMGKEMEESKPTKKLSPAEKKDLEESLKLKKGGLVKKKPVAAKAKAPAAKSRTNALNKYYGK